MIPASQARRRAAPGEMGSPVSRWAALSFAHQRVELHEDDHGGVEAAGPGELLGRVAPDHLDEGLSEALGVGLRSPSGPLLARCLGAANANSAFFNMAPVTVSIVNRPWVLPCPSSHITSRVAAAASRSSRSRSLASWASAVSGSITSRMRRPRILRALASKVARLFEQMCLGLGHDAGVEVVGEVGERAEDDLGLLDVQSALRERGTGQLVLLEALGEPDGPVRLHTASCGWSRRASSRSRTRRCHRAGRSASHETAVGPSARRAAPRLPGLR